MARSHFKVRLHGPHIERKPGRKSETRSTEILRVGQYCRGSDSVELERSAGNELRTKAHSRARFDFEEGEIELRQEELLACITGEPHLESITVSVLQIINIVYCSHPKPVPVRGFGEEAVEDGILAERLDEQTIGACIGVGLVAKAGLKEAIPMMRRKAPINLGKEFV